MELGRSVGICFYCRVQEGLRVKDRACEIVCEMEGGGESMFKGSCFRNVENN